MSKRSVDVLYESEDDLFNRVNDKEIMNSKAIRLSERHNKDISDMFMNRDYSDCVLRVDGQEIPVNRSVLSVRSEHFRALFFGQMRESKQSVIELLDIRVEPFRHVLHFLYSGNLLLNSLTLELVIEILRLAQYYCLQELVERIVNHLKISLSISNIFVAQKAANLYSIPDLIRATQLFIDQNADQILSDNSFLSLSSQQLVEMFKRDSFYVENEENILKAVCLWFQLNTDSLNEQTIEEMLSSIRVQNIKKEKFRTIVESMDLYFDFFNKLYEKRLKNLKKDSFHFRSFLVLNQNVATNRFNARVVKGRRKSKLMSESNRWYSRTTCACHSIAGPGDTEIVIELSKVFLINHIVLILFDIGMHSYKYQISVSLYRKNGYRLVVDYENYWCRSYQYLFFEPQAVRFIQIKGIKSYGIISNVEYSQFDVVHLECMYCTVPIEMEDNLVKPKDNVFGNELKPTLNSDRKYLETNSSYEKTVTNNGIVSKVESIPFERGSVCWFADNCIYLQLSQPFIIDSMAFKFNLSAKNLNLFSFCVEISSDYQNWKTIQSLKQLESIDQKVVLNFNKEIIIFVRISSTNSLLLSNLESFECPHSISTSKK